MILLIKFAKHVYIYKNDVDSKKIEFSYIVISVKLIIISYLRFCSVNIVFYIDRNWFLNALFES